MKKKDNKKSIAHHEWKTGDYDRHANFKFVLSCQFLMLCKLMSVTPYQLLLDFMDQLSQESWSKENNILARQKLVEYFLLMGYGQDLRTQANITGIFKELDAISTLWPINAGMELIELHAAWREKYYEYWFEKNMDQAK